MAFTAGRHARVWVAGLQAAAYANTMSGASNTAMHDVTVFTDDAKTFIPGQESAGFNLAGPFDTSEASAQANTTMKTVNGTGVETPVSYFPSGTDQTNGLLVAANQVQFDTSSSVDGIVEWTLEAQPTGAIAYNGELFETATVTTDTDGTTKNDGAASSNGAIFHLHVTAFTGLTSDVIIIEGSTTGSFGGEETTVATFATVNSALMSGVASDRQVVTGTVPRYLRVVDDVTGTGSITRTVTYARL